MGGAVGAELEILRCAKPRALVAETAQHGCHPQAIGGNFDMPAAARARFDREDEIDPAGVSLGQAGAARNHLHLGRALRKAAVIRPLRARLDCDQAARLAQVKPAVGMAFPIQAAARALSPACVKRHRLIAFNRGYEPPLAEPQRQKRAVVAFSAGADGTLPLRHHIAVIVLRDRVAKFHRKCVPDLAVIVGERLGLFPYLGPLAAIVLAGFASWRHRQCKRRLALMHDI